MGSSLNYAVGSPSDTKLINSTDYYDTLNNLRASQAGYASGLSGLSTQATQAYGKVADQATNYNNFLKSMMGGGGIYENLRNDMSSAGLSSAANQALSDQYSSGREYAQAAGTEARRQAANELSAAGLLSSGGGVGAMTEATAQPILQMENQLAGTRANYMQNRYSSALQGALQAAGLGLQAQQGATAALSNAGQGYANLANTYGSLAGQNQGYLSQLSEPVYWNPSQYGNYLNDLAGGLSGVVSLASLAAM